MIDFNNRGKSQLNQDRDVFEELLAEISIEDEIDVVVKNDSYKEYEIIIKKINYIDEYSGFGIFKVSPLNIQKPIYSDIGGFGKPQYEFSVKIQDKELTSLVKKNAKMLISGHWFEDEHYGLQFVAEDLISLTITSEADLRNFLISGQLPLVDEELGKAIVAYSDRKKINVFDLLEAPDELKKISLVKEIMKEKPYIARNVAFEWFHYKQAKLFCGLARKFKLKEGKGRKIYKHIIKRGKDKEGFFDKDHHISFDGLAKLSKVKNKTFSEDIDHEFYKEVYNYFIINPYLFMNVNGVGFKTLDEFSLNYGIKENDPRRVAAIIGYSIEEECAKNGDTVVLFNDMFNKIMSIKGMTKELATIIFKEQLAKRNIVSRKINFGDGEKVYVTTGRLFADEFLVAKKIKELNEFIFETSEDAVEEILSDEFNNDRSQSEAIINSYKNAISIITGGPGSGKTTTIRKLIYILNKYENDKEIILLAPTGKAAKRIDETLKEDDLLKGIKLKKASTIHKLIFMEDEMGYGSPEYNNAVFIIDESSMIDINLMARLIKRINKGSRIIFVGDIDQIPPVGLGQVMRDFMDSKKITISELKNIHRVNKDSKIPENARLINQGKMPKEENNNYLEEDYAFISCSNDIEILSSIEEVIKDLLNNGYSKDDIQVITPQHSGIVGVNELNPQLRWLLNEEVDIEDYEKNIKLNVHNGQKIKKEENFIEGDRIINKKNNYELEIFNGEMGKIKNMGLKGFTFDLGEKDGRIISVEKSVLKNFDLSYAITVHKAQGSEAPVIIMPLSRKHSYTLNKFLLYTGITRAKEKVIIIGEKYVFYSTLNKNKQGKRLTTLNYEMEKIDEHLEVYNKIINNVEYVEPSIETEF